MSMVSRWGRVWLGTVGGAMRPRKTLPSLIVTRYFPNQPASRQPANAWHMRFVWHARTHARTQTPTTELKIIKWWRRSGRQQREKKRRRPSERKREGRSDCTNPCESRSKGKSTVLKLSVELDGFPHFINNL